MGCRSALLLAFLALFIASALPVASQQLQPQVTLTVTPESVSLENGKSAPLEAVVRNTGQTDGTVSLTYSQITGWKIDFVNPAQQNSFTVPAGGSAAVPLTVTAAETGEPADTVVTFTATIRNTVTNQIGNSAGDTVTFDFVPPALPPPAPIPPPDRTLLIAGLSLAGLVLVVFALYVYDSSTVRLGLEGAGRGPITLGSSDTYLVAVTNTGFRPRRVQLRIQKVPHGWFAAFSYPSVLLQPKETANVPLNVRAPLTPEATGPGTIHLTARPGPHSLWLRKTRLSASYADVGGTAKPPEPPVGTAAH